MVAKPWVRPDDLVAAVSEWTGIDRRDLLSAKRGSNRVGLARFLLWAALRQSGMSYTEIGSYVDRHYTTVMTGIRDHPAQEDELEAVMDACRR